MDGTRSAPEAILSTRKKKKKTAEKHSYQGLLLMLIRNMVMLIRKTVT